MAGLQDNTLRMVLVGRTGSGKSATGNTILGKGAFVSRITSQSVTKSCQKGERVWEGRKLLLVDTPGLFDTEEKLQTTCEEIAKCVILSSPGPHAIILVVQLGRFTEEEHNTVELVKAIFGKCIMKHMIVLFTRKEDLQGQDLSSFIADSDKRLKALITECQSYCAFNNRSADEAEKDDQVKKLVELIDKKVQANGGAHFSDSIYEETAEKQRRLQETLEKISATNSEDKRRVEEKYAKNEITKQEMENQMKVLIEKHAEQVEKIKKEAEENIFVAVFNRIWRMLSFVWRKFWK